jgi:hypothetical protein
MVFVADPIPANPEVGDTFAVEVRGKDFPNTIDGGGLNITFDSGRLQLVDITPAQPWVDFFSPGTRSNSLGTVKGMYFNSMAQDGVGGEFDIANLTFAAISGGSARIQLAGDDLLVFGRLQEQFMPRFQGREVSILAVPEPGTWLALCVGSLLIVSLRTFGRRVARP